MAPTFNPLAYQEGIEEQIENSRNDIPHRGLGIKADGNNNRARTPNQGPDLDARGDHELSHDHSDHQQDILHNR